MIEIWGHRGASVAAPENTLPAFQQAIADGADGLEFDVQLSSDGHPVVIHDETLDRTTNGHGRVIDHTLAELRALDASAGMPQFAGCQIPRLQEVLELATASGCRVNVELKNSVVAYPGLEEAVLAALAETGAEPGAVLSSFSRGSVAVLHALTELEVALLFDVNELLVAPWRTALTLGANALHAPRIRTTKALVRRAHDEGLKLRVWTADHPAQLKTLARYGVDGIFTDVPDAARVWVKAQA